MDTRHIIESCQLALDHIEEIIVELNNEELQGDVMEKVNELRNIIV